MKDSSGSKIVRGNSKEGEKTCRIRIPKISKEDVYVMREVKSHGVTEYIVISPFDTSVIPKGIIVKEVDESIIEDGVGIK